MENPPAKTDHASSNTESSERITQLEGLVSGLQEQLRQTSEDLMATQKELYGVRAETSRIIAAAEQRLFWIDKYHLGPETFENRRYARIVVRGLAFSRKLVGYFRKFMGA